MRTLVAILLAIALFPTVSFAQPDNSPPTLDIPRLNGEITIDGKLTDIGWRNAAYTTDFTQFRPVDNVKPAVKSEVYVTYDASNLYLGFIAHDDPAEIRATLSDRDHTFDDDFIGIILDTYGDAAWAYEFYVNPLGVQGDLLWVSGQGEDSRFDLVYETEAIVTDSGWQAEMAIPFSSLRFPDAEEQIWRATFWRSHPRGSVHKYSWAPIEIGTACFFCEMGYLTGIEGVESGSQLDILPAVVAFQSGSRADPDDLTSQFGNTDIDGEAELNLRYRLRAGLLAEASINPDFSQVESDAAQIDVNTTYALFFPERRPFFQEGSDLYNTWVNAIYTRSINDPEAAFKLTGRQGRSSYFVLSASDENSPMLIPLEEGTEFVPLGKSYSNLGRFRRTFGDNSHIGALFTDRRIDRGDGSNTVYGADAALQVFNQYRVELQAVGSHTAEPDRVDLSADHLPDTTFDEGSHTVALDGEEFDGLATVVSLERSGRLWNFNWDYNATSPTFRADNGFITRAGTHYVDLWNALSFRPDGKIVTNWQPSVSIGRIWNWEGIRKDEWVRTNLYAQFSNQTEAQLMLLISRERLRTVWFDDIRLFEIWFSNHTFDAVRFGGEVQYGNTIARTVDPLPVMGRGTEIEFWATFKPLQQFTIQPEVGYLRLLNRDTRERIFEGSVFRTRLNYQFTRRLFTRVIVQYDQFDDELSVEPLVTYKINPFTIFYVGASSEYGWDSGNDISGRLKERQFFAKFQYLFRM